jgi:5'-nucleotidase
MNTLKPLILVTNDDGVSAPGLDNSRDGRNRRRFSSRSRSPSGMGHAITTNSTLYLNKISKENDVIEEYSCSEPR